MKKVKYFICLTMAFLLILGVLPAGRLSPVKTVEAKTSTITTEDVKNKINEIWLACYGDASYKTSKGYWLGGKKGPASNKNKPMRDAANRGEYNYGTLKLNSKSQTTGKVSNYYGGVECNGFARWVEYCLIGKVAPDLSSCNPFNWKYLKAGHLGDYQIKAGDFIQMKGSSLGSHFIVVWETTEKNIRIIECNINGYCHINTRTFTWKDFYKTYFYKADAGRDVYEKGKYQYTNYNRVFINPYVVTHSHKKYYNDVGVCSVDNFNYYSQKNISSAVSGVATPKTGSTFYVYSKPYEKSGKVLTDITIPAGIIELTVPMVPMSLSRGTIVSKIKNHLDETWYELKTDRSPDPVYVSGKDVNVQLKSKITFSSVTAPKDQAVEGNDARTIVKGTVKAQNANLSEITAAVYDVTDLSQDQKNNLQNNKYSAAQAFTLAKSKAKYKAHITDVNAATFDLNDFDSELKFRYLSGGHNYLYVVTATDTNGVNACSPHSFFLRTSSSAKKTYTVDLKANGSISSKTVIQGDTVTLPTKDKNGYDFLGWAEDENAESAKYEPGFNYKPVRSITLYAVFRIKNPPAAPMLAAVSYDIGVGDTQMVSWSGVNTAKKYIAYVYDENGTKIYEQPTTGTSVALPFPNEGEFTVKVEAFNGSLAGGSGESVNSVTVRVHGSSTVTFLNHDGSVYTTEMVPYGETAETPTSPSRAGYTFSRWVGDMSNVTEDRTLTAEYTAIPYTVIFYDKDGNELSRQTVTYNGDEPGSAVEPANIPEVENYSFMGWDTGDWEHVTYSGVKVHPVYVWADADMPIEIEITNVELEQGEGYWVYYTATNHGTKAQLGRVIIAGKTRFGKFVTQTESGAFYLRANNSYSSNVFVPVSSSDMQTLAMVEAYVVDSYKSTKPIAMAESYWNDEIFAGNGEYSEWMTAEQLASFTQEYDSIEEATQYRFRNKIFQSTTEPLSDETWIFDSQTTVEGEWGDWSSWQDAAVTANDMRQVETKQVLVSAAVTKYRYGRYKSTNSSAGSVWYHFSDKTAQSQFGGTWTLNYTSWSTTRHSVTSANYGYSTQNNTVGSGKYNSKDKRYYWDKITIGGVNYWWEEKNVTPAKYKTQYRYRDKADDVTTYTYYKWSDWSAWSGTEPAAASNTDIESRPIYRVKLVQQYDIGTAHEIVTPSCPEAAGKSAILMVYKVDEASDYSNQYIEQVTLDENGSHSFTFYTLDELSEHTGDYTVMLTVEGATESLFIEKIEAPKPQYTVTFRDSIGLDEDNVLAVKTVSEGGTVEAPEAPEHDGYYFLGWDYGLGNIRENMTITARYVEKKYTVVFVDSVNYTVSMLNDLPYSSSLENLLPEVPEHEGYHFLGWKTAEGETLSKVTGHMIITAEFEQITNEVHYLAYDPEGYETNEGEVIKSETIGYGEYAVDPFAYEGDLFIFDDDEDEGEDEEMWLNTLLPQDNMIVMSQWNTLNLNGIDGTDDEEESYITEDDMAVPDLMYFVGWSEGAEDPVTQELTLTPILRYLEDVEEVESTLAGGVYVGEQVTTLACESDDDDMESDDDDMESDDDDMESDDDHMIVEYRIILNNDEEEEGEWVRYDLETAPEIEITQTCVLEIEVTAEDKNSYSASFEYVIVSEDDVLAAPAEATASQNDEESVIVTWSEVSGADGYLVTRTSDCDEIAEFDVGSDTSFTDYGVDELRTYTYEICAYSMIEQDESSLLLEGNASSEAEVFFYGDNTLVTDVSITAPENVYERSATQLTASVSPTDAYDSYVTWTCEDGTGEGYITSDGLFYGLSSGTVTVTAKAADGSNQSDSVTINVQEIVVGEDNATITVSSAQTRAGGTASINVSVSENSLAEAIQFAVLYDSSKLTLTGFEAGEAMHGLDPTISNPSEGVVLFVWDSLSSLTAGGSMLDLTFAVNSDAEGTAVVAIPTDGTTYDFVFARGNGATEISVASVNGVIDIASLLLGDVDESGRVNVIDANLVRRYAAKLVELSNTQLLAGDVNGDGKINVIDANLIRRYVAHLIDVFPAEAH